MNIPTQHLSSGYEQPRLGLGTWDIRGQEGVATVLKAFELGYNHVDTAEIYGNQREIGRALQQVDRASIFVTSKVPPEKLHREDLLASCQHTLRNLQTEYFVLTPCDTPFMNMDVIEFLFQEARNYDAAIPLRLNGYLEPLQAVYKSDITLKAARDAIEHDELSILDMIRRLGKVNYVSMEKIKRINPNLDTFFNINTYSDLEEARKRVSKKK